MNTPDVGSLNLEVISRKQNAKPTLRRRRLTLPRTRRLRGRTVFDRVFQRRCSASDRRMVIYAEKNGLPYTRLGLVVGRKLGNAVQRNRLKRLVREAFRLMQHELPQGYDLICLPRSGPDDNLDDYKNSLKRVTSRAVKQLTPPE